MKTKKHRPDGTDNPRCQSIFRRDANIFDLEERLKAREGIFDELVELVREMLGDRFDAFCICSDLDSRERPCWYCRVRTLLAKIEAAVRVNGSRKTLTGAALDVALRKGI